MNAIAQESMAGIAVSQKDMANAVRFLAADEVLGPGTVRIGLEAAVGFGWDRYVGTRGSFVGMQGFGASAPASELYTHFGITAAAVVDAAKTHLTGKY